VGERFELYLCQGVLWLRLLDEEEAIMQWGRKQSSERARMV
jgi:hypothetical protein